MRNNKGNTLIAIALVGGSILFVSSFINASLRAFRPAETDGSVKGVFMAQRATYTPEPLPRIDLKANGQDALSIPHNTNFTLSWSGAGISSCTATGQWSGAKAVSGSETKNNGTSTVGQWNSEGTAMIYRPTNFSINYYITCTPSVAGYTNVTDMVVVTGLVPTATPTAATAPRATNTPQPSPYVKVIVKDTKGVALSLSNATVCSGTWGGQVVANKISTSNCVYSPSSSFNIPFDQYRSFGANSGIFVKLPSGWSFTSITSPDNEGDLVAPQSLTDERGETGRPIGWATSNVPVSGYATLSLVVQLPPSYGYIKQGNVLSRVTYYAGQAATTACGSVTTITTCSASPAMTGTALAQCTISGTAYPIHSNGVCPSPTPVAATAQPTTVQATAVPTTNPACAKNCALQPKGDASCNLVVDSEDYTIWRNNLDKSVTVGTSPKEGPDFNNDGKVNLKDLQIWQDGLFTPPPTPAGACAIPTSSVKPTDILPTLGPGCRYQQVQCVQAPCPPIVVCPTTAVTAPPGAATVAPTIIPTNPPVASWTQMSTTNAPSARFNHVAAWTGSKMIIYGGNVSSANIFAPNPGYLYDPVANTWTAMTSTGTPGGTMGVSNGTKFVAFGGSYDLLTATLKSTGGIYDIASNTWTAMNLTNAPAGKRNATMVSTGTKVIVWGGYTTNSGGPTNTGGVFDIASNTWTPMSTTNAPSARAEHTAVWTGSKMIVFGGVSSDIIGGGGIYDLATNTWSAMSTTNAPASRYGHTAVWSNNNMIIWGGLINGTLGSVDTNTGAAYNPATNTWLTLSTTGAPSARDFHSAVANGTNMIIWGGSKNINTQFLNDGGIYNILSGTWSPLPANASVPARNWHSAVWTGNKMIIWGGATATSSLNTGAIFTP